MTVFLKRLRFFSDGQHTQKQGGRLSREPKLSLWMESTALPCHETEKKRRSWLDNGAIKSFDKIPRICLSKFLREKIVRGLRGVSRFREVSTPPFFLRAEKFFGQGQTEVYNITPSVLRGRIPRGKWQTAVLRHPAGGRYNCFYDIFYVERDSAVGWCCSAVSISVNREGMVWSFD